MQLVLSAGGGAAVDHHRSPDPGGPLTLLRRVQSAVWEDAAPPGEPLPGAEDLRPLLTGDDHSLQIHACHGRARQVEVVRDAILHLLAEDPSLEPRDVIVMCPDIEAFAPLIHATFGAADTSADGEGDEVGDGPDVRRPPDLRVRLADRSLRQTNPVLGALASLLDLVDARMTSAEVLDFAGREPVRRRFRLDEDDLSRMAEWVGATGIRWGLDGPHRAPFKLGGIEQNTWRAGLDRVLAGVAVAEQEQRLVAGVLPLDDVESGAIDLAGRFAELVDRLHTVVLALSSAMTVTGWAAALGEATGRSWTRRTGTGGSSPRRSGCSTRWSARRPTTASRAPPRSSSPRCGGCSVTVSAAAPHGPTSAPGTSRSARWSRCARSPTGSCACSASTTAPSPAARSGTVTTWWQPTRSSVTATVAARTASCCSTPSSPPPTGS
jgi:hypothetical protein